MDGALHSHPVTIIIFPGIFGEFIDATPFHEVFSAPLAAYGQQWEVALADYERRHSKDEVNHTLFDEQFSLDHLSLDVPGGGHVRRHLSDLIEVSSIDDVSGKPLVRVVLLRPALMSLETLGDIEDIATTASRRLRKLFAVMGTPQHIVLLGYSMGANVALDALAKAWGAQESWVANVRAVVTVGGVIYGSHIADQAICPQGDQRGTMPHTQVALLRTLARTLQETRGLPLLGIRLRWSNGLPRLVHAGQSKLSVVFANTKAWMRFAHGWATVLQSMVKAGLPIRLPMLLRLGRRVNLQPALGLVARIGFGTFKILSVRQYSLNIRKFKRLVDAVLAGVESLSTPARRRWWEANTLPTDGVRYFAIAATMTDSDEVTASGALGANVTTYNPLSVDYQFLLQGYRDFAKRDASTPGSLASLACITGAWLCQR
jgi:pimeloyl-ACP methyl ester carboxylesterase